MNVAATAHDKQSVDEAAVTTTHEAATCTDFAKAAAGAPLLEPLPKKSAPLELERTYDSQVSSSGGIAEKSGPATLEPI